MKSRPRRFLIALLGIAVMLLIGFFFAARPQQPQPFHLPEQPDMAGVAPGVRGEDLQPRPEIPERLQTLMNMARGRPPAFGDAPEERVDWYWQQRMYPGDSIPVEANLKALTYVKSHGMTVQSAAQSWQSVGPSPLQSGGIGIYQCGQTNCDMWRTAVGGRTKAIAFNPNNPNILYVATAVGGIWKSTDGGNSYTPITADQPTHVFQTLTLDPTNPDIIYAGSGEIHGYYGIGILKSTDGGRTWALLGKDVFKGLVVSAIVVHPQNHNIVYAATSSAVSVLGEALPPRGVFKSTDGGHTWTAQASCDRCAGISDLVMEENNPQVLYAGAYGGGVLKSTDGGAHWGWLTNGLPDRGFGRVELAIGHGSQSGILYAGLAARVNVDGQVKPWGLLYKSTDHGQSWQLLRNTPNYCSTQCGYDNIIAVHPTNANIVYIGGNMISNGYRWGGVVHKSTDGGATWQDMTPGTALNRMVHPDMHAIAFRPGNPNDVWVGCDGGIFRTTNGGQTWAAHNGNINTLQFEGLGVHPTNPDIAIGGLQDNAKAKFDGSKWTGMDSGDAGYSAIDPFDPSIWYSTRYSMQGVTVQFQRNDQGGTQPLGDWPQKTQGIDVHDRVEFYVPFALDQSQAGVIYLGTHRLYHTANRGESWQAISGDLTRGEKTHGDISAIAIAPNDSQTIYTGSSDGIVSVTHDGGNNWQNITGNLPNRYVSEIAVSSASANTAYVVFNGYNTHTPQTPGHVFKTTNGGQSWQNISSNLPDIPVLSIALDPEKSQNIYIGTDIGVFRSTNDGGSWAFFNQGLATVPVRRLVMNRRTGYLWAATNGRGIFRMKLGGTAPTPTPTPPTGPLNRRMWMPVILKQATGPTPTPPATGPRPGQWAGEKATFAVTSDQKDVWSLRILAPVPGCPTWMTSANFVRIRGNQFIFDVNLGANGVWSGQGTFQSGTSAQGVATFKDVYFGTSCGTWSGQVNWTATWQSSGNDPTVTPTPTPRPPTPTPGSTSGIHGQVRYKHSGIGGITLFLRQCPSQGVCGDLDASKVAQTVTNASGYYQFTNVPTLPANSYYFVYYLNHTKGGNTTTDRYLWRWFGPDITSYQAGGSVAGGDFDIDNFALTGPRTDRSALPVTFIWDARPITGEHYAWELFDIDTGKSLCYSDPDVSSSFRLTRDVFLNSCHGQFGKKYGWFAWAVAGSAWDNNQGFGDSYYYAAITIDGDNAPTATPTPLPTPTATPTSPPGGTLSGQVTDMGTGVSGVTLQLLGCDSASCALMGTTVTNANGQYAFTNLAQPGAGESYRVRYINGSEGGNGAWNPDYLYYWVTGAITHLSATASFDISDVTLLLPDDNTADYLPMLFAWLDRGVGGDAFSWTVNDGASELCATNPSSQTSYTLDAADAGQCGLAIGVIYAWYVYVANHGGIGCSGYYRSFMILGAANEHERRLPQSSSPELAPSSPQWPQGLIPETPPQITGGR